MPFWKKIFGLGDTSPRSEVTIPLARTDALLSSVLMHITRPRGLSNDETASFFEVFCARCGASINSRSVDHIGTVLAAAKMAKSAVLRIPGGLQCPACSHSKIRVRFVNVTPAELSKINAALRAEDL